MQWFLVFFGQVAISVDAFIYLLACSVVIQVIGENVSHCCHCRRVSQQNLLFAFLLCDHQALQVDGVDHAIFNLEFGKGIVTFLRGQHKHTLN